MNIADTIEREITINAPIDDVWELISEPGWWINDGTVRTHIIEERGDGAVAVTDDQHGEFLIEIASSDAPRSISYRWLVSGASDDNSQDVNDEAQIQTLVSFELEEADGGTIVRLVESGFTEGEVSTEVRVRAYHGNVEGWDIEMSAAKAHVEAHSDPA